MATALGVKWPNLLDLANSLAPNGGISEVAEILNQTNPILDDMPFIECNDGTRHKATIRTGLPVPTWRKLYGGVQPTKSTRAQVADGTGMLEAYAEVDKSLVDISADMTAFRLSEDKAFIEGMSQEFASTLFYGNEGTEPEAFTGLTVRYNALSTATAPSAENVITGGGSSANASIWLIVWDTDKIHGLYPKGSKAGLSVEDKGAVTIESIDGSGGRMEAYRTHYKWDCGLSVRDWRYAVRIPNIATGSLTYNAATGANLPLLMSRAVTRIPNMAAGRACFYMNRTVKEFWHLQMASAVASSTLTFKDVGGNMVAHFNGIMVKQTDALTSAETTVA